MRPRRPATAATLCLVGAVLVLVAAGRSWVSVLTPATALGDAGTVSHAGTDLAPVLPVLGLVGLAGAVAVHVTRRSLVGWVLLATGAGVVACVLRALGAVASEELPGQVGSDLADVTAWSSVTVVGGVLLFAAGAQRVPAPDPS